MQNGHVVLRAEVVGDGSGRPSVVSLDAAALDFDSISIHTSDAKLAWLYNAVAEFARTQIQDAITREVADQVNHFLSAKRTRVWLGFVRRRVRVRPYIREEDDWNTSWELSQSSRHWLGAMTKEHVLT